MRLWKLQLGWNGTYGARFWWSGNFFLRYIFLHVFSFLIMHQNCSEKNHSSASAEHFAITWKSTQLTNWLPGAPVLAQTRPTLPTRFAIFLGSGRAIQATVFPVSVELVFLEVVLTFLWVLLSGIIKLAALFKFADLILENVDMQKLIFKTSKRVTACAVQIVMEKIFHSEKNFYWN